MMGVLSFKRPFAGGPPTAPLTGSLIWWRADTVTLSGSNITQFNDLSGNGNNIPSTLTAATQTASDSTYNNKATASMAGTSVYGLTSVSITQPMTYYCVGHLSSLGAYQSFFDSASGGRNYVGIDPSNIPTMYAGTTLVPYGTAGVWSTKSAVCNIYDGASSQYAINAGTPSNLSSTPGTSGITQINLLGYSAGVDETTGKFAELIAYAGHHTAAQVKYNMRYLGARYGISIGP